jgi:hypothetical protein
VAEKQTERKIIKQHQNRQIDRHRNRETEREILEPKTEKGKGKREKIL